MFPAIRPLLSSPLSEYRRHLPVNFNLNWSLSSTLLENGINSPRNRSQILTILFNRKLKANLIERKNYLITRSIVFVLLQVPSIVNMAKMGCLSGIRLQFEKSIFIAYTPSFLTSTIPFNESGTSSFGLAVSQ